MRGHLRNFWTTGLIFAILLIGAGSVLADTVTLRPDGVVSAGTWTGVTAASLSDQSDATLASITGATASTFTISLQNSAAYAGTTITSVDVFVRANVTGGGGAGEKIDFGANAVSGTTVNLTRNAWTDYTKNNTGPWTPATIDTLNVAVSNATLGAGETMQVSDIWVVVNYTPPADTLSVTANTAVANAAAPLATDVQMQFLQVDSDNVSNGNCVIASVTVDDLGTAGGGDIANLKVHIDSDNNFGNGVLDTVTQAGWAGTSTVVDLSSIAAATRTVTNGTSKYIWITYDLTASADTKTVQSRVTAVGAVAPDGGATGTWDSNSITVTSGPANTLTSCAGCHAYPPTDSTTGSRNAPGEGDIKGDHQKHTYSCAVCHVAPATETSTDFAHRDGNINVSSGSIGISDDGTYSRGATFAQSNIPTTGTCSNVNCHGNTVTPQWGVGATTCSSCHQLPPATGAHASHYTAKGWATGNATNCSQCHPDNSSVHSNVTDGVIGINAGLNYAGGSCSGAGIGLGCHNEYATPVWSTGNAVCTSCHTAGGGKAGDPASGLHAVTPSVSGQKHDQSVTGGCSVCHSGALAAHWDGIVQGGNGQTAQMGLAAFYTQSADNTGTCSTTACHRALSDDWTHRWNSTANYYTTSPSACGGCHGDWDNTWNTGVIHRSQANTQSNHGDGGTNYDCYECHALEHASYAFTFGTNDWGGTSKHGNSIIEVNNNGTNYKEHGAAAPVTDDGLCYSCHLTQDGLHNYLDTGWSLAGIAGPAITVSCGGCHSGGVTPSSTSGAHTVHGATSAQLVAGGAACVDCHGNNGGLGFNNTLAGTHGTGSVDFASATYSTAVRNDLTGTCLTANCHNRNTGTDQSTAWNSAALACDDCHYYAAGTTPTSAGNTAHARPLSADHGNHLGTGGTFACSTCHGADPVAGDTAHINGATSLTDKAVATQDEANVTVATWSDAANTCANTACHNPSGTSYLATWQVSTVSCDLCHSSTSPGTGSHTAHLTASGTFGISIACSQCHPNNAGNNRHLNSAKDVQVAKNSVTTTIASPTALNGCGTNDCHNNGISLTTGTPGDYTWGTPAANCTLCHGDAATQASNAHNEHMNAGYTGAACTDCHTGATAATHINKSINLDSAKATYSRGAAVAIGGTANGTCATANCHNRSGAVSAAWNTAGDLACDACHYYAASPTGANNSAHFAPLSTSHNDHFDKGKLCTQCHGADPTTTAHISVKASLTDGAVALQDEAAVSFTGTTTYTFADAGNTCGSATNNGLGCHATGTPDWDVAFASTACTNCHTNTTTAAVNPTSGLHGVTPSVSGQRHDSTVAGGCAACHTSVTAQATHMNGTFTDNGSVAGDRTAMGLAAFYANSGADNSGTCSTTACHLSFSDDWAHKWNSTANYYTTAATACGGCHGDWSNTWNTGVIHRSSIATQSTHGSGTTYQCKDCHALEASTNTYTFTFGTNDWGGTSKHGNAAIEVNNNGVTYNAASGLCTTCHTIADGTHNFLDTSWPIAGLGGDGISGSCSSCHAYPPDPADGKTAQAVEGKGAHIKHVNHIKLRAGVSLDPATDTFTGANVAAVCGVCHDTSVDANHSTGGGARNMRIPNSYQFGGTAPTFNGTVGQPSSVDPKSCSNVSCHFKTTPVWE